MSVVIVANGPIEGLGKEIDQHDIIIRMHHADITPFIDDVGKKLTIWVAPTGYIRDWMCIPQNIHTTQEIWTFSQERGNKGPNHELRVKYGNKILYPGKDFMGQIYSMFERGFHPTKGFLTLYMTMQRFECPIHIVGYSFYESGEGWFWNREPRPTPHPYDIELERKLMGFLIEDGKVIQVEKKD